VHPSALECLHAEIERAARVNARVARIMKHRLTLPRD
jgi:hypothetical protein